MWSWYMTLAFAAPLSFDDALQVALDGAPAMARLAEDRRATTAQARSDGVWLGDPSVEAERVGEGVETRLSVPLPLALQPIAKSRISSSGRAFADHTWEADRAAFFADVGRAFLDLQRTVEIDALAHDTLALAIRMRDGTMARKAAGETGSVDAATAMAVAITEIARASRAHQDVADASLFLEALLGREPDGTTTPAGWPELAVPRSDLDPVAFPSAVAARDLAERRRAESMLAKMDAFRPEGTFGVTLAEPKSPIVGVSLPIPLALGPKTRAADASALSADASARELELSITAAWRSALRERTSAEEAWAASSVEGLDGALDALALAFDAGELSLAEYVTRRDAVVAGLATRIDARWRLESAALTLWELSGTLPPKDTP